jgi:putative two-component system response regulator
MRVLIADDDEIALELLEHALVKAGYTVETARDGQEALELVRHGGHRLVISDWEMPRLTGVELCRAIRAEEQQGYVYLILLTSHNRRADIVTGLSAGADDFIAKPFDAAELIQRVRAGERILSLETRDVAIFALAKLAESRDPETGAHLERVQCFSRVLAQHMAGLDKYRDQIDAEFIRLIYLTSPLHDIGKVGIPDSVLLKPGRLSDREFEIMKTHAAIGAQTLSAALAKFPEARFLKMACDIAATHHERWDGRGYPVGLSGEDIPLCGRIVTLADVYDALTSKRVYKDAFQHEIARSIILEESGSHFDPSVVEAFLACEEQFIAVRERFSESQLVAV